MDDNKYELLSQELLQGLCDNAANPKTSAENFLDFLDSCTTPHHFVASMSLELLEYRKLYGPLGCTWLEKK